MVLFFFLEIEIVTTEIVNSKSFEKICHQLLSTMYVKRTIKKLNQFDNKKPEELESKFDHFDVDNQSALKHGRSTFLYSAMGELVCSGQL